MQQFSHKAQTELLSVKLSETQGSGGFLWTATTMRTCLAFLWLDLSQTGELGRLYIQGFEGLRSSSSLPDTDIVGAFADLVSPFRLPVRDSFQGAFTRSLALLPNS
jgi:hypothetical protein